MSGSSPSTVYLDSDNVRLMGKNLLFSVPDVAIQKLPPGETESKTNNDIAIFFLQEFHPETFKMGVPFEMSTTDEESLTSFRQRISEKTKIQNIGLVSGGNWPGRPVLEIPSLNWKVAPKDNETAENESKSKVRSLYITDGDLIFFKDTTKELKELTKEEQIALRKEDASKRNKIAMGGSRFRNHAEQKESKLVIQQKDFTL